MTALYLEALAAIAASLSVLMAGAWVVQQRTGNSGWVDTIWTFSLGLVGAGCALWPVAGAAPNARQWLVAALGPGDAAGAGLHVLDPGLRHRHPAAGGADAALARRPLSRLSVAYQSVLPAAAASMIPTRRAALAQTREWSHELRIHHHRHRRAGAAA